jgi:hypothetical protein
MPQGIVKTKRRIQLCRCLPDNQYRSLLKEGKTRAEISVIRNAYLNAERRPGDRSQKLKETAEIPPELANCVADYAHDPRLVPLPHLSQVPQLGLRMEVMAVASCSGIRSKVESCPICAGFHIRGSN